MTAINLGIRHNWLTSFLIAINLFAFTACNVGTSNECEVDLDCGEGEVCVVTNNIGECVDRAVAYDCSAYEYDGQTYNCDELDRCTEQNLQYRLGCCECDTALCNPDPTCEGGTPPPQDAASSCMKCHNGATQYEDYSGTGQSNPHPFPGAAYISCVGCHGGNAQGDGKLGSHVTPPPQIGDKVYQTNDAFAYFNRLTQTGLDKLPDYTGVNGQTHTALDYIQFINPGDLRVVTANRSCGYAGCHEGHADWVSKNPIATETGFYSSMPFTAGVPNSIPEYADYYQRTAAEYGFRTVVDDDWTYDPNQVGYVGKIYELPEYAQWATGEIYANALYDVDNLVNYVWPNNAPNGKGNEYANQVIGDTPLSKLILEATAITCGDCHLGSAGANNRYGDFRSSGCTACHMEYSLDGRSRTLDPNVNKLEPANADAIAAPERSHPESHQIRNVAKVLPNGAFVRGIADKACVGCHQGSNRTVLQFWGVRLDQNQDLVNEFQYPANPANFVTAANDPRFFDPAVNNNTFNGRIDNQLIVFEDYDNDNRDDTPPDVHYEAGMGCIDCHGSRDLHGGTAGDDTSGRISSREDQAMGIECESCHGGVLEYATYIDCTSYTGEAAQCPTDRFGNPVRNVSRDVNGDYWLISRLNGLRHFVPQTKDTIIQNNKVNPLTGQLLYSPAASYAMGVDDGNPNTGVGPQQANIIPTGFSHGEDMECVTCHAAWTNNCIGCHIADAYDANPNNFFFSNTTGERIVLKQQVADFTYITPVPFYLGVSSRNKITSNQPGMKAFVRYFDLNGDESDVYAFTDRNGNGNNPNYQGRGAFGSLAHNRIMPHSVRGKVNNTQEGPRYCVSCHLTTDAIANFADYPDWYADYTNRNYANFDFDVLQAEIGQNTGNQNNSPYFVHMAAGLGSGLFLFDNTGCPVNPLDANANRQYCPDGAPADNFDPNNVAYDLDRIVEETGVSNSSSGHPLLPQLYENANALRQGSLYTNLAGPLGGTTVTKLADPAQGLILDSWLDADGVGFGQAANYGN